MTDEQRLSEALHEIVPSPPERPERGPAVGERVRRHRRRTAAATVAVAAAVVVVAVAVPAALSGTDGHHDPVTTPTPVCPGDGHEPETGTLPAGAVAVRLCVGPGTAVQPPDDALTNGVGELLELVNSQPEQEQGLACTTELGRGYQLAFTYPDGQVRTVDGEMYGCDHITVGPVERSNPEVPFERFIALLRAQRAATGAPTATVTQPDCSRRSRSLQSAVVRPGDPFAAATLCVARRNGRVTASVAVPDDKVKTVLDGWVRGGAHPRGPAVQLVATTAWGDRTVHLLNRVDQSWGLDADAMAIVNRLLAAATPPTPETDAGSSAEEVVVAYVDRLNAGDRAGAAALWQSLVPVHVPAGYTRIDYRVVDVHPLLRISAWRDATAVVARYREVLAGEDTPYRRTVFTLGRDEQGTFRIVSVKVGEVMQPDR